MAIDRTRTPSEYGGSGRTRNSVGDLGPNQRELSSSEKLRLGYLTGQDEDPNAAPKPGNFKGVDPDYPDFPNGVPVDYTDLLPD